MIESCWVNNWFSVLVNGESCGFFKSTRGLRQGNPLSPILFIIAAEALSRGFFRLITDEICNPFKLKQGCLQLSHLLYADDMVLLINGSRRSLVAVKEFLQKYQAASGQCVNQRKSAFFCSSKLPARRIRYIKRILGFGKATRGLTYLGAPIV